MTREPLSLSLELEIAAIKLDLCRGIETPGAGLIRLAHQHPAATVAVATAVGLVVGRNKALSQGVLALTGLACRWLVQLAFSTAR